MALRRKTQSKITTESSVKWVEVTAILAGTSNLIFSRMTEERTDSLPGSVNRQPRRPTEDRTPEEIAAENIYRDGNGLMGIPSDNVWRALVQAGKFVPYNRIQKSVTRPGDMQTLLTVMLELLPPSKDKELEGFFPFTDTDGNILNKDVPWVVKKSACTNPQTEGKMCVYRPMIRNGEWHLAVRFRYNATWATPTLIKDLFLYAGIAAGFGAARPGKGGQRGKWEVIKWICFPEEKKSKAAEPTEMVTPSGDGGPIAESEMVPVNRLAETIV